MAPAIDRANTHDDGTAAAVRGQSTVTENVLTRVKELESLTRWVWTTTPEYQRPNLAVLHQAVLSHLAAATDAVLQREHLRFRSLHPRKSERYIQRIRSNLDAAEAQLLNIAPPDYLRGQIPQLLARVQGLPDGVPQRTEVERLASRSGNWILTETDRSVLVSAIGARARLDRREEQRLISFRNAIRNTTLIVTLVALTIAIVGALELDSLKALTACTVSDGKSVCPSGFGSMNQDGGAVAAGPADFAIVELTGMIGGAIGAAVSLRGFPGTVGHIQLFLWLALLKLPTASLTAVTAILLIQGGFIPGFSISAPSQLIAYALIFGYSQQLFTRFVDTQAQHIISSTSSEHVPRNASADSRALETAVASTLRSSFSPARLLNYDGTLSLWLNEGSGDAVPTDTSGRFIIQPPGSYDLVARIGKEQVVAPVQAAVRIRDGDSAERVPFELELLSDQIDEPVESAVELRGAQDSATVQLSFTLDKILDHASIWVRLAQKGTLVQIVELPLAPPGGTYSSDESSTPKPTDTP